MSNHIFLSSLKNDNSKKIKMLKEVQSYFLQRTNGVFYHDDFAYPIIINYRCDNVFRTITKLDFKTIVNSKIVNLVHYSFDDLHIDSPMDMNSFFSRSIREISKIFSEKIEKLSIQIDEGFFSVYDRYNRLFGFGVKKENLDIYVLEIENEENLHFKADGDFMIYIEENNFKIKRCVEEL